MRRRTCWIVWVHSWFQTHSRCRGGNGSGSLVGGVNHPAGEREGWLAGRRYSHDTIPLDCGVLGRLQTPLIAIVKLLHKLVQNCGEIT